MAGPFDTEESRVRVATTLAGTYNTVGYVTAAPFTEGSTGSNTSYYMGGELVKAGRPTLSGTFNWVYIRGDTNGQDVIRAAKRTGASIFLQICPEGTGTGAQCFQFEAKVDEIGMEISADDDWVTSTVSYTGVPSTLSDVTLA